MGKQMQRAAELPLDLVDVLAAAVVFAAFAMVWGLA